jgi:geranylgeranyl diphosphate synthase type II
MDNSPLRRGRSTVHVKWDSATAILTGDVMIGYAYKLLPNSSNHSRTDIIRTIFSNELIEVCEGQVLDMMFNGKKDVSMNDYIQMIDKKTARLIETAAVIGGHIGLGSESEINSLRVIARNAGLAFQIQDDLLDMTADESDFGKKIGKDIVEGKKTFLILTAIQNVNNLDDKKLLNEFITNNGLKEEQIPLMDDLFKRNNIYSIAQNEIDNYYNSIEKSYDKLKENEYTNMLKWLLSELNKRIV